MTDFCKVLAKLFFQLPRHSLLAASALLCVPSLIRRTLRVEDERGRKSRALSLLCEGPWGRVVVLGAQQRLGERAAAAPVCRRRVQDVCQVLQVEYARRSPVAVVFVAVAVVVVVVHVFYRLQTPAARKTF